MILEKDERKKVLTDERPNNNTMLGAISRHTRFNRITSNVAHRIGQSAQLDVSGKEEKLMLQDIGGWGVPEEWWLDDQEGGKDA